MYTTVCGSLKPVRDSPDQPVPEALEWIMCLFMTSFCWIYFNIMYYLLDMFCRYTSHIREVIAKMYLFIVELVMVPKRSEVVQHQLWIINSTLVTQIFRQGSYNQLTHLLQAIWMSYFTAIITKLDCSLCIMQILTRIYAGQLVIC